MRRFGIFPIALALVVASLMAPYQHVHLRNRYAPTRQDRDDDDNDAAIVHIHFYAVSFPLSHGRANLSTPGDDDIAHALDTFHAIIQAGLPALALPASEALLFAPRDSHGQLVEWVEACGHDPPALHVSIPRAPPA